jgi:hypothetical protein
MALDELAHVSGADLGGGGGGMFLPGYAGGANLSFVSPPTTLLVESCLRFAELIPQGQGKVPRIKV